MHTKIKSKWKFLRYTILYASVPYYTKIKSKHKFKIRNIKLSKISLPMVYYVYYMYMYMYMLYHSYEKYIMNTQYNNQ